MEILKWISKLTVILLLTYFIYDYDFLRSKVFGTNIIQVYSYQEGSGANEGTQVRDGLGKKEKSEGAKVSGGIQRLRESTLVSNQFDTRLVEQNPKQVTIKTGLQGGSQGNKEKVGSGCSHWDTVIDRYAKNEGESIWAKRIMRCESSCNEKAYNPSGASGLFQIIPKWHPTMVGKVFDGEASIQYSLMKYRNGGAGLWVCK